MGMNKPLVHSGGRDTHQHPHHEDRKTRRHRQNKRLVRSHRAAPDAFRSVGCASVLTTCKDRLTDRETGRPAHAPHAHTDRKVSIAEPVLGAQGGGVRLVFPMGCNEGRPKAELAAMRCCCGAVANPNMREGGGAERHVGHHFVQRSMGPWHQSAWTHNPHAQTPYHNEPRRARDDGPEGDGDASREEHERHAAPGPELVAQRPHDNARQDRGHDGAGVGQADLPLREAQLRLDRGHERREREPAHEGHEEPDGAEPEPAHVGPLDAAHADLAGFVEVVQGHVVLVLAEHCVGHTQKKKTATSCSRHDSAERRLQLNAARCHQPPAVDCEPPSQVPSWGTLQQFWEHLLGMSKKRVKHPLCATPPHGCRSPSLVSRWPGQYLPQLSSKEGCDHMGS